MNSAALSCRKPLNCLIPIEGKLTWPGSGPVLKNWAGKFYIRGLLDSGHKKERKLAGLINYLEHEHLGKSVERWAWLNHLHLDLLTSEEKIGIINYFLNYLAGRGMVGVIEWNKGYYSQAFLYRCRFFPYFRSVNLLAWIFNPALPPGKIKKNI